MKRRILLIEDDPLVRRSIESLLQHQHFAVLVAVDGRDGLTALGREPVDLIITDILMPNQDGIETLIAIKQAYPEVPVIAISGGFELEPEFYLRMAQTLGATRTLKKPFNAQELIAVIREILPLAK